jgi:hypothetical protein
MDFEPTIQRVEEKKSKILKFASKFIRFTPYSDEDFLSAAYQAAIITEMQIEGTDIPFEKYFWKCYKTVLSGFVPNLFVDNNKWSLSIPTHMCVYPEDITVIPESNEKPELIDHMSDIYDHIEHLLKPRHKTLLRLLLGLDEKGRLTPGEAAIEIGCTRQSVTVFLNRLCAQIRHLVGNGTLDFSFLFDDLPEGHHASSHTEDTCRTDKNRKK